MTFLAGRPTLSCALTVVVMRFRYTVLLSIAAALSSPVQAQPGDWVPLGEYSLPVVASNALYVLQEGTLLRSLDAGDTWSSMPTSGLPAAGWQLLGTTSDGRLIAGSEREIYLQIDDGAFESLGPLGSDAEWVVGALGLPQGGLLGVTGREAGALSVYSAQPYRWEPEAGWVATSSGFGYSTIPDLFSIGEDDLAVQFYLEPGNPALRFSRDGGDTWAYPSSFPGDYPYNMTVLSDGGVLAGGIDLYLTEDAGDSWQRVGSRPFGKLVEAGPILLALGRYGLSDEIELRRSSDSDMGRAIA